MNADSSTNDQFRIHGHLLIDFFFDYLNQCGHSSIPVTVPLDPEESYRIWQDELTKRECNLSQLFQKIISDSVHLHHPGYVGHQVASPHPFSTLADLTAAFLNNGMAVYEMGQVPVAMERVVCKFLTDQIGWGNTSSGFFTSGGSLANLTALLTARQVYSQGKYWDRGHDDTQYAVMVSAEAHYCIARTVKIMGLGADAIITIPVDEHFQLRTELIQETYNTAIRSGKKIFAFVGNAGSTATGSYDDLQTISAFCRKNGIWLHVDGAHGGAVILSDKYRHLTKGLEHADSMTLDFHKLLQTSILCTALLYKSSVASHQTFSQGAAYLYEDHEQEWYQLGKRTFECTKSMMVLKAYTLLHQVGIERLGQDIDYRYDLAKEFADTLLTNSNFELATYPQSNIVCFRYTPKAVNESDWNHLNHHIRLKLNASGNYYLVQTTIDKKTYLRTSLMNPATEMKDLHNLIAMIQSIPYEK